MADVYSLTRGVVRAAPDLPFELPANVEGSTFDIMEEATGMTRPPECGDHCEHTWAVYSTGRSEIIDGVEYRVFEVRG